VPVLTRAIRVCPRAPKTSMLTTGFAGVALQPICDANKSFTRLHTALRIWSLSPFPPQPPSIAEIVNSAIAGRAGQCRKRILNPLARVFKYIYRKQVL
jgi:hypothetical protein